MYIEASQPARYQDNAILSLPGSLFPMCMEFYYNMYGQAIGALRVYRSTPDRASKDTPPNLDQLWELTGPQSRVSEWKKARVMIPGHFRAHKVGMRIPYSFKEICENPRLGSSLNASCPLFLQIFIEAVVGRGYTGDIAIDDITFTKAPCSLKKKRH